MDKLFKLKKNNTTVGTEILAGVTTFFAMAYIIFVNPNYLSATGMNPAGVLFATCVAAAIGCFLTAFLANAPFAQAPGMGLNALFAFTVATGAAGYGMGYSWQQGLAIVLISGVLFLIVALTPLRGKIISSIPASLKAAIGAGIGLFIAIIGFINSGAGIIRLDSASNITALNLGSAAGGLNSAAMLTIIGVIVIAVLMAWKVKGAIFIGIIVCTLIGIPMGITQIPQDFSFSAEGLTSTVFQLDFTGLFDNIPLLLTAVITFAIVDCFDTVGTLIGTAGNAGMLDENGNYPEGDKALIADAVATCAGAVLGTSTVTTYVESSTGISEGGRTGLTSAVVGVLFLIAIVLAPFVGIIPGAATAPALIIVGVLMMRSVTRIEWDDIEIAIPAFLTIAMMPFAYSISDGIGFGFISYTIIKMSRGKFKEVPVLLYVLSALFIVMYVLKIINI
ncbi:MAG: NCS2 family permease [Clostridia bacterium]|nr:NCS2 family permease [Clostridia bacterium]